MTNQQLPNNNKLNAVGNLAIYQRRATQEKRNQEQKKSQQHDLIHRAHELGFEDSHIILFEDNGKSGNLPIDKRVGLASIMQEIAQGTIQAILVANEARLFRDKVASQLYYFITVCTEHNIVVYTRDEAYDFSNPNDVKLFQFNCEQAFQYLQYMYKITQRGRRK